MAVRKKREEAVELEKLTLRWLLDHLTLRQWITLASSALALVIVGVYMGEIPTIRKLLGRPPISAESALLDRPAKIAVIPEPFAVSLIEPYDRSNVTHIDVHLTALEGRAVLLPKAELLSVDFTEASYLAPNPTDPQILLVRPSVSLIDAVKPSATVSLDISSAGIIPLADVTTSARAGDKYEIGTMKVRLFFSDDGQERALDTTIPMLLVR
jgi:hypothetical protein